jgi:hypothetical protein
MKLNTLYSRSVKGKVNTFIIEIESNKFRSITGFDDGKKPYLNGQCVKQNLTALQKHKR